MNKGMAMQRFWNKIDRSGDDDCWPWTAATARGYGRVHYPPLGKVVYAHRLAYFIANGSWPALVRHGCDNPLCCNARHLVAGTHQENMADMVERGRQTFGERNGQSRMTDNEVQQVRDAFKAGMNRKVIAAQFSISLQHVYQIGSGTRRKLSGEEAA